MFYVGCSRVCSDCSLFRTCINFRKASCEPHEATRESAKRATYCYTCDVTLCNLTSDGILSKFLHRCCRMQSHDLFFGLFSQWCSWNPKTKPREVCNDCYWRIDFFLRGVRDSCWPHDHCANFYWSLGRVLSCYCSRDSPNTLHPSQAARGTAKTAERRRRTDRAADSKHVNAPVTQLRVFLVSAAQGRPAARTSCWDLCHAVAFFVTVQSAPSDVLRNFALALKSSAAPALICPSAQSDVSA